MIFCWFLWSNRIKIYNCVCVKIFIEYKYSWFHTFQRILPQADLCMSHTIQILINIPKWIGHWIYLINIFLSYDTIRYVSPYLLKSYFLSKFLNNILLQSAFLILLYQTSFFKPIATISTSNVKRIKLFNTGMIITM